MGLETEIIKAVVAEVTDGENDNNGEIFHANLDRAPTFHCIIADRTPAIQTFLRSYHDPLERVTKHEMMQKRVEEWVKILDDQSLASDDLNYLVLLVDKPNEVTSAKAIEHDARKKNKAYKNEELVQLDIREPPHGRMNPKFAMEELWGDRERLWSTKLTKPMVGHFWLQTDYEALARMHLPMGRQAPIHFILDGPWMPELLNGTWEKRNQSWIVQSKIEGGGPNAAVAATTTIKPWTRCLEPLLASTGGEADVALLSYLNPTFGQRFLIRSDDGDILAIVLLYYFSLVFKQRTRDFENENESDGGTVRPTSSSSVLNIHWPSKTALNIRLPDIWIDRTINYRILTSKNKDTIRMKYINVKELFIAVCAKEYSALATAACFLLRGADFVIPFVKLVFIKDDANEYPALQRLVEEGKVKMETPKSFSSDNVIKKLYPRSEWHRKAFSARLIKDEECEVEIVQVECDYTLVSDLLITHLYPSSTLAATTTETPTRKKNKNKTDTQVDSLSMYSPPALHLIRSNLERLTWTLNYWLNTPAREVQCVGRMPYRYEALELVPRQLPKLKQQTLQLSSTSTTTKTGLSLSSTSTSGSNNKYTGKHGFMLEPCKEEEHPEENSTTVFSLPSPDDDPMFRSLFDPQAPRTSITGLYRVIYSR